MLFSDPRLCRQVRGTYDVTSNSPSDWIDRGIPTSPAGFGSWSLSTLVAKGPHVLAVPYRRVIFRPWFHLARARRRQRNFGIFPRSVSDQRREDKGFIQSRTDGELFLYVNDVVTPLRFVSGECCFSMSMTQSCRCHASTISSMRNNQGEPFNTADCSGSGSRSRVARRHRPSRNRSTAALTGSGLVSGDMWPPLAISTSVAFGSTGRRRSTMRKDGRRVSFARIRSVGSDSAE